MRSFAVLCSVISLAVAGPLVPDMQAPDVMASTSYAYALDLSTQLTLSGAKCLKSNYYSTLFIRAYSPAGNGAFDSAACSNVNNANSAGLGTEVYMTPQPKSTTKNGTQQFDELYSGLKKCNVVIRSVWIQVTSPINWNASPVYNVNFLNSIISRASQYGVNVGIYTNQYDWNQITNGASGSPNGLMLWYWSVNGSGTSGETAANFNDFRAFGYWNAPNVKQFAQVESVCGYTVNRDVYSSSSKMAGMARRESSQPIVGSIAFN
ncbi:hypothetical protein ANCCEY_03383 [Ancylostoma ceylanicum]|uniref:Lysozyme n=2 Tax=Ancylostoma ceylanicum TaxID=53326 RepID=A0A016TCE0_9BILA|nr:hypothetical protein ANCCEY_03383 [Ancylostoma ceylanicum]EYC00604.1 hypothetical protein Y032_0114g435 [Ancylostoma ceylanicum]